MGCAHLPPRWVEGKPITCLGGVIKIENKQASECKLQLRFLYARAGLSTQSHTSAATSQPERCLAHRPEKWAQSRQDLRPHANCDDGNMGCVAEGASGLTRQPADRSTAQPGTSATALFPVFLHRSLPGPATLRAAEELLPPRPTQTSNRRAGFGL